VCEREGGVNARTGSRSGTRSARRQAVRNTSATTSSAPAASVRRSAYASTSAPYSRKSASTRDELTTPSCPPDRRSLQARVRRARCWDPALFALSDMIADCAGQGVPPKGRPTGGVGATHAELAAARAMPFPNRPSRIARAPMSNTTIVVFREQPCDSRCTAPGGCIRIVDRLQVDIVIALHGKRQRPGPARRYSLSR
jgi:hypothetical protein